MRTEPSVSEPTAAVASPAATAAAEPPDDPPAVYPWRSGLCVGPKCGFSVAAPSAPSSRLVLPISTAPAARRRDTACESCCAMFALRDAMPAVVGYPAMSRLSLTAIGTPSSRPIGPSRRRRSAASACSRTSAGRTSRNACNCGSMRVIASRWISHNWRGSSRPVASQCSVRHMPAPRMVFAGIEAAASIVPPVSSADYGEGMPKTHVALPARALPATIRGMSEREVMEYDVVVVGAGPAGLAFAIRLKQLQAQTSVCVIEKASTVGGQILSGAVIEPAPLDALLPEWRKNPPPICVPAKEDEFWMLSKTGGRRLPLPPGMKNHGNFIVSLGAMCAWLAPQAEALGVEVFPGFSAADNIYDERGAVAGVRIGDMGVARVGSHKSGYTPGVDIKAKVTVLAEGARGSLTKQLIKRFDLGRDCDPQGYSIGIKELWQVPAGRVSPGKIVHSIGWPADTSTYGGSFLYHLDQDRIALGYVSGLDYRDPEYMPWEAFQQWKNHPTVKPLLDGGQILSAGARAIVTGG